jgi:hypothetical protein
MPEMLRRLQRPVMRRIDFVVGDGIEIYCRFTDPVSKAAYDMTGVVITGQVRQLLPGTALLGTFVTTSSVLADGVAIATLADTSAIVAPAGSKSDASEVRAARYDLQATANGITKTFLSGTIYRIQQVTQ